MAIFERIRFYLSRITMRIVSPSMLSADFGNLERDTKMIDRSQAEWLHIDVMDGVFVPNISFGFPVLEAIKRHTGKIMDVHLMIAHPGDYVARFAKSGADYVTFHIEAVESTDEAFEVIKQIKMSGARAGISVKPGTPISAIEGLIEYLDMVLVMSVEPGFGGQKFMPDMLDKCRALRAIVDAGGYDCLVQIDGGISADNAKLVFDSGIDVVVAGSAIFGAADPVAEVVKILEA